MSQSKVELKVGVFVAVGLVMAACLLVWFSHRDSVFTPTYEVRLKSKNVGGIKPGATVLMAGVPVGTLRSMNLTPDGSEVVMVLRIQKRFPIHGDATFVIETAGVLGDQYVAVIAGKNQQEVLKDGALVTCEAPFDLQEAARAAAGFLRRIDLTAQRINEAILRLDRTVLAQTNLESITATIGNLNQLSQRALDTVGTLDSLLATNSPGVNISVSNLVGFSTDLNAVAGELRQTLSTNGSQFASVVRNLDSVTAAANGLLSDLQAGKGLAGTLLKDDHMQFQVNQTVNNLTVLSSNLARFGLLHKPRPVKTNAAVQIGLPPAHRP